MLRSRRTLCIILAVGLIAAACGDDGDAAANPDGTDPAQPDADAAAADDPGSTTTTTTTQEPDPEPSLPPDPLLVETTLGPVRGAVGDTGVNRWTAIPFAAPPLGENRWRAPQPHPGWTDEFAATGEGLMCPQPGGSVTTDFLISPPQDEDCLTLSVWAPDGARDLPTMVWIHGGGLTSGSAHQALYEGTDLAAEGVVVVAINYRLGTLGFLAHPEATENGANFGIMDQQAALQWTRDNIAGFGGDPENVTIFGESAGGFSVCAHLASDPSLGLFHKGIIESGGGCLAFQDLADAHADAEAFVADTSCAGAESEISCLRDLPVEELAVEESPSSLVADGVILDEPAIDRAAAGTLNDIPIMTGSNRDEFTLFTIGLDEPTDAEIAEVAVERFGADGAEGIIALYPAADFDTNLARLQAMLNDLSFTCSAEAFAQTLGEAGGTAYRYYFTFVADPDPFGLGATHGAEMVFVFANPTGIVGLPAELDPDAAQLSAEIQRAWTTFAADGAPEAPVAWMPTTASAPTIMQLDRDWTVETEIRDGRCAVIADALLS